MWPSIRFIAVGATGALASYSKLIGESYLSEVAQFSLGLLDLHSLCRIKHLFLDHENYFSTYDALIDKSSSNVSTVYNEIFAV